jgi:CcmD family protein
MEVQGKIFVVVGVLAVIMAGLYVYLFYIDRKLRKLEKQIREKE